MEQHEPTKTENTDLLSQFYNLVSLDENVRIETVINIVSELKNSQKKVDLDYTVERLVKGIGSSRKAARQGYATALTHVLSEFKEFSADQVLNLISNNLPVTGAVKGQEERDRYFGQVFAFLAICKAKAKEKTLFPDLAKTICENLMKLMKKKSYLQEICARGICDIIQNMDFRSFEVHILPIVETCLKQGWSSCTPEDLMIVLVTERKFQKELPYSYLKGVWQQEKVLHHENFKHLSQILMETTHVSHPRVHSVWEEVLKEIVPNAESLKIFWKNVVEDGLLQSTHQRKFLALNILLLLSSRISADQVVDIYSKSVLRCIINSCQSKENYLFNAVKDILKKLPEKVAANGDKAVLVSVIKALVGSHGNVSFDAVTHTKTVDGLASKIDSDLKEYFSWLSERFLAGTTYEQGDKEEKLTEKDVTACRAWIANQLTVLSRCCKSQNDESLLEDIAKFLFLHGYFDVLKKKKSEPLLATVPEHPLSDATHKFCQQKFLSVLTDITHFHVHGDHGENVRKLQQLFGGVASDDEFFALKVLKFAQSFVKIPTYVQLAEAWTPEVHDALNNTMELIATMEDGESESFSSKKGIQLLFIHTALQLFSSREEAVDILQELQTCYQKAEEKKKRKKKEPHWTEVLTEILMGFLAQPSHLLREVVDAVFPSISAHLTHDALNLLINAIKPKQKHEDDGFDVEEEEIDAEVGDTPKKDCKAEDDEDAEEDKNEVEAEEEEESSDSDDDDDDSEMEFDEEFKAELKAALGDSAVNTDDEEDSDDEEKDIDMDSCDPKLLEAMDQALVSVFRARKQKQVEKKKKKNVKQTILHFKLRVLDLIEIFVRKQPKDPKILMLLEPLLEVIKASHGRTDELALFERTLGVYKNKLCNLHEYPKGAELDVDQTHAQIEKLIKLAKTASSALFVTYITQGVVYLIRVLRGTPDPKEPSPLKTRAQRKRRETIVTIPKEENRGCLNEDLITKCYSEALHEFMTSRSSHLQPILFTEVMQRFPDIGWKFGSNIPQYMNIGCNNFRKVKAGEMLKLLFSKKSQHFDESFAALAPAFQEHLIKVFESTKDEAFSLKARQVHDMVHLADIFLKHCKNTKQIKGSIDVNKLRDALSNTLDSPVVSRSTSLHSYCEKVIKSLENSKDCEDHVNAKKKKKK